MTKKVYVAIEIIKIFFLSWFVKMVYDASISSNYPDSEMAVIGYTFLIMLGTLVISSIVLDILISFFTPKENQVIGEWEKVINKNILRNFSYALSVFFIAIMISFALTASQEQIILILRIGFIVLITAINLTKAYYYAG
jgi:hypothetical protein